MASNTGAVRTTRRRLRIAGDHAPADPPTSLSDALPDLVRALDDAADQAGWGAPPTIVRVTTWPGDPRGDGFDLGVRPLDGDESVVEALAGFTAPREWEAIGVVTEGNARHLVDPGVPRRRVRCVHLIDRAGTSASTLRLQGADATVLANDVHRPRGRIDDVCRRALGLSTLPPEAGSVELWARVWLERVLRHAGGVAHSIRWREVAEQHPAVALLVRDDEQWGDEPAANLTRLGELLAEVHSWPVLRLSCAAGEWPVDDVPADLAGWLDDGSFSRWVLGGFPSLADLVDAVCAVVPLSVARGVRAALQAWRLDVG
ncbi:MAG TPA: hypothetical protein VGZ52_06060 [Acidimicrobiales bacterium]|jgi:hypothetical protein|nr:hypothetical protein [Acidimicrobiales bacterium]